MSYLTDPITVTCKFQNAKSCTQGGAWRKIIPLSFEWHHHLYFPLKTVFQYPTSQGTEKLIIFSCQAKQGIFDLVFNLKNLSWRLKSIHEEI